MLIGIDFGTTNSVVAIQQPNGTVRTARFGVHDVFRTVLCFWLDGNRLRHEAGPDGVQAYLDDPVDSRLIMSMKTYLAQASFTRTLVHGRPFTLEQLVATFLHALLADTETSAARIVAGRPVRFAGDLADDALGERRLRAAFHQAGFGEIDVALEPEAAGHRFTRTLMEPATLLIGDFGGGTSDFSILRFEPGAQRSVTPLATIGIGVAGDSLDARIIDRVVSPALGKGGTYRVMRNDMPVPAEFYAGLARWHRLSMMRTPKTLRDIAEVARTSAQPAQLEALISLIREEQGYTLYQAVSGVKAALSSRLETPLHFQAGAITIDTTVTRAEFEDWIRPELSQLSASIDLVLAQAGLPATGIDRVFLTGGTAFVPAVRRLFETRFGTDRISGGGEFVSVAEGLVAIGATR